MDELPPKAAALLRAARREHDPNRADSERVRHALAAALAAPALSNADGHALALGKTAGRWLTAGWIKGVAVVGLVAGATLVATWKPAEKATSVPAQPVQVAATAAASETQTVVHAAQQERAPHTQSVEHRQEQPAARDQADEPLDGTARATGSPRARVRAQAAPHGAIHGNATQASEAATAAVTLPAAQAAAEPEPAPSELPLMRRALERLNAGDPQGALEQLSLHAARFPNGVMTEEREGLRAVAWCKGGDPARGFAAAHSFLRLYPDSPLLARVRGACKDDAQ